MGRMPYIEASVGIYNIFKLLHIEYVRRFTYTDIPGHRQRRHTLHGADDILTTF